MPHVINSLITRFQVLRCQTAQDQLRELLQDVRRRQGLREDEGGRDFPIHCCH